MNIDLNKLHSLIKSMWGYSTFEEFESIFSKKRACVLAFDRKSYLIVNNGSLNIIKIEREDYLINEDIFANINKL